MQKVWRTRELGRKILSKTPAVLEKIIAIILLVGVVYSGFHLVLEALDFKSLTSSHEYIENLLNAAFNVIIVIEFVRMLVKHSMNTIVEALIFAIARGLVAGHEDPVYALIRVLAIAILLFCRKYFFNSFDYVEEQ